MVISVIEMLELPSFGHITTYTIQLDFGDVRDRNYDAITFTSNYLY